MTNTTTAATVETLTAEVRTLVVGSRQVTLSVAKQLDVIPLDRLEVMGRVKIDKESTDRKGWVIGVDVDGSLALAKWNVDGRAAKPVIWDDEGPAIVVCRHKRLVDFEAHLKIDDIPFIAFNPKRNPACKCVPGGFCSWDAGEGSTLDEVESYVKQQAVLTEADRNRAKAAAAAPLIVLAGLK